jgi:hypothetical protein
MSMSVNIIEVWKLSCFDWWLCNSYIEGDDVTLTASGDSWLSVMLCLFVSYLPNIILRATLFAFM